ncbi:MAG: bifunctional aspartate kinase/homoserine dehydrogenase I [Bacteroidota bacterium]
MKILKFGGTSVGSPAAILQTEQIVRDAAAEGPCAIVVSAFSKVTNMLVSAGKRAAEGDAGWEELFRQIEQRHTEAITSLLQPRNQGRVMAAVKMMLNELEDVLHGTFLVREQTARTADMVLSFGERLSSLVIAARFSQEGIEADAADARRFIRATPPFGKARVDFEATGELTRAHFAAAKNLQVVTGFIAGTAKGETTTLGRGGSDYTAAILGAALKASIIEIWTDVDGMLTADPNIVKNAFTQPVVSYQEAMELSHFGAKVIYPPTLQPAFSLNIPIRIANTFNPSHPGTLISERSGSGPSPVKGISSIADISLINLQGTGIVGVAGVSAALFGELARQGISVILISQASSEHSICVAVSPEDADAAADAVSAAFAHDISAGKFERPSIVRNLSVVAIIGDNMKRTPGVAGRVFTAFGNNGINVVAAAQGSSELNISVVIDRSNLSKALNALHETFFASDLKTINLFLVGPGQIGSTLLKQINRQRQYLAESLNVEIRLCGAVNSKNMLLDAEGIVTDNITDTLAAGEKADMGQFMDRMQAMNLPNSVLADCTANTSAIPYYARALMASIAVVTPNKTANSGQFADYAALKQLARAHNTKFLYETNVGAGLPVIGTLQGLINSGDRVLKIEAVLSGTVSYIFNNFSATKRFADAVREAQALGYTEPDPRDDLNGRDMGRKMLILARETGLKTEPEDIEIENILPESALKAKTVAEFYEKLDEENAWFEQKRQEAAAKGGVLRFIGSIEGNKVGIRLETVDANSPFYAMSGADNMIVFTTDRYLERKLVVKGPGAGAEVTSAGVFSEIISLGR